MLKMKGRINFHYFTLDKHPETWLTTTSVDHIVTFKLLSSIIYAIMMEEGYNIVFFSQF